MNKRIAIGSQVFFGEYEDYKSHDKDFIEFQDNPVLYKTFMVARGKGNDIFFYKTANKEEFIKTELKHAKKLPMAAGKFLVPELAEYLGLTIEDLKQFEFAFESMDDKHSYEKKIYDFYIENNGFTLTQEQRDEAYKNYKSKRYENEN